jgi:hypothetical protein
METRPRTFTLLFIPVSAYVDYLNAKPYTGIIRTGIHVTVYYWVAKLSISVYEVSCKFHYLRCFMKVTAHLYPMG